MTLTSSRMPFSQTLKIEFLVSRHFPGVKMLLLSNLSYLTRL